MHALSIQYVRAVAALLVVFYHATVYLGWMTGASSLHETFGGIPGLLGVLAFFILSGYLMATLVTKYRPVTFLWHRVARIYPTYWGCVLLAGVFYMGLWKMTLPNVDYVPNLYAMLSGSSMDTLRLVLAPIQFPDYPLGIEWTLLYETTFYVMVFMVSLVGLAAYLPHLAGIWLTGIVAVTLFAPELQLNYTKPTLATLPVFEINAAFIMGILGVRLQDWITRPALSIGAGVLALAVAYTSPNTWTMLITCGGLLGIILGLIGLEKQGRLTTLPRLAKLGDWSYALYLVHIPVILGTIKLLGATWGTTSILCATLILSVLAAGAIGTLDLIGYAWLKRALAKLESAQAVIVALFIVVFLGAAIIGVVKQS